jgi:hypothetical protein
MMDGQTADPGIEHADAHDPVLAAVAGPVTDGVTKGAGA